MGKGVMRTWHRLWVVVVLAALLGCQLPSSIGSTVGRGPSPQAESCAIEGGASSEGGASDGAYARYSPLEEADPPKGDFLSIPLLTQASGSRFIQVPSNGPFEIHLVPGDAFALEDADARDGRATVTLPARNYDLFIRSNACRNATLDLTDRAYMQSGMLDADAQRTLWLHLGQRVFPVDARWGIGDRYVLSLRVAGAVDTELRLYGHEGDVPLPPGVKWVDVQGGEVSLPGVATLNVPAGAVSSPQLIRISQRPMNVDLGPEYQVAGPMVAIEPTGLQFQRPVHLEMAMDSKVKSAASPLYYLTSETGEQWDLVPQPVEAAIQPVSGVDIQHLSLYFAFVPMLNVTYMGETEHYVIYLKQPVKAIYDKFPREAARIRSNIEYIKYMLERSYAKYKSYQSSPVETPLGYPYVNQQKQLRWKSPVYLHTDEAFGITVPFPLNPALTKVSLKYYQGPQAAQMLQTVAHEVFHQFQYACLEDVAPTAQINKAGIHNWILEGPARYMGLAMLFEAKAELLGPLVPIAPDLADFLIIPTEFNKNWELMGQPLSLRRHQVPDEENGPYQTSILFAAIANRHGYPALLEIAREFRLSATPEEAIDKVLRQYGSDLSAAYHEAALIALKPNRYFMFPSTLYAPRNYRYAYPATPDPIKHKMLRALEESLKGELKPLSAHYYAIKPVAGDRLTFDLDLPPHQRVRVVGPKDLPTRFVADGDQLDVDPSAEYQIIVSSGQPQGLLPSTGEYDIKVVVSRTAPAISSVSATYVSDSLDPRFYRGVTVTWTTAHAYEDTYTVGVSQLGAGDSVDIPVLHGAVTEMGRQHQLYIPVNSSGGRSNLTLAKVFISASSGASAVGSVR